VTPVPEARRPYPALYEVNTRVLLDALGRQAGGRATFDDVPDDWLDELAAAGFEWVWLVGVWQTGEAGRQVSRRHPEWRPEFERTLPDLTDDDICGSGFAIVGYSVQEALGGEEALARLRARMHRRGLLLMLDFVANHTALDHPWVGRRPDYYLSGTAEDRDRQPQDWVALTDKSAVSAGGGPAVPAAARETGVATGPLILAHGRDPDFPGWPDTLQLDYSNPALVQAMTAELLGVAEKCDGVRCDMSMLLLPEVFERTWGRRSLDFWPTAIDAVRSRRSEFVFMAEVYWDFEWQVQEQGFDYTYDKRLYDRLRDGSAIAVRDHLQADVRFQEHLVRFLENHDEPRAAAVFSPPMHQAAAVIAYLTPGMRFFQQGQLEGYRVRVSPHLCRAPEEETDPALDDFYGRLLACIQVSAARFGAWNLLGCREAWDHNSTWQSFVCSGWAHPAHGVLLVTVNYAPHSSQCYLQLPYPHLAGSRLWLRDLMSPAEYLRHADTVLTEGLYLDLPAWGYHVFSVEAT
jgi:glycosidase